MSSWRVSLFQAVLLSAGILVAGASVAAAQMLPSDQKMIECSRMKSQCKQADKACLAKAQACINDGAAMRAQEKASNQRGMAPGLKKNACGLNVPGSPKC